MDNPGAEKADQGKFFAGLLNDGTFKKKVLSTRMKAFEKFRGYPINSQTLKQVYEFYDSEMFSLLLDKLVIWKSGNGMLFELSNRARKKAGHFESRKGVFKIKLQAQPILNCVPGGSASGLHCSTPIEGFIITVEHEVAHAIQRCIWQGSKPHGKEFKRVSFNIFGHTDIHHDLDGKAAMQKEEQKRLMRTGETQVTKHGNISQPSLTNRDVKVGQRYIITMKDGRAITGTITKINRVKVLMEMEDGIKRNVRIHVLTRPA
jgi:hypothetical protein